LAWGESVLYYSGERSQIASEPPVFNLPYPVGGLCNLAIDAEKAVLFVTYMD